MPLLNYTTQKYVIMKNGRTLAETIQNDPKFLLGNNN